MQVVIGDVNGRNEGEKIIGPAVFSQAKLPNGI
jgi:hypothetical protein